MIIQCFLCVEVEFNFDIMSTFYHLQEVTVITLNDLAPTTYVLKLQSDALMKDLKIKFVTCRFGIIMNMNIYSLALHIFCQYRFLELMKSHQQQCQLLSSGFLRAIESLLKTNPSKSQDEKSSTDWDFIPSDIICLCQRFFDEYYDISANTNPANYEIMSASTDDDYNPIAASCRLLLNDARVFHFDGATKNCKYILYEIFDKERLKSIFPKYYSHDAPNYNTTYMKFLIKHKISSAHDYFSQYQDYYGSGQFTLVRVNHLLKENRIYPYNVHPRRMADQSTYKHLGLPFVMRLPSDAMQEYFKTDQRNKTSSTTMKIKLIVMGSIQKFLRMRDDDQKEVDMETIAFPFEINIPDLWNINIDWQSESVFNRYYENRLATPYEPFVHLKEKEEQGDLEAIQNMFGDSDGSSDEDLQLIE